MNINESVFVFLILAVHLIPCKKLSIHDYYMIKLCDKVVICVAVNLYIVHNYLDTIISLI